MLKIVCHRGVWCAILLCFSIAFYPAGTFSQSTERGLVLNKEVTIPDRDGTPMRLYEGSYALVIGISNYTNGWPSLPGVKTDVEEVKSSLEAQGFEVVVKMDLDHEALDRAFDDFIGQYGHALGNRLLFYFAGHGHTVKTSYGEELGYIVPADAPNPNKALPEFQTKAMEMQQIEIYAKRVQSKHALFLFDACFSGSLFALSRAVPQIISYKTANPVRQFITSGSAEETVPDESIFRAQFVRALEGEADRDQDGFVTGSELGEFLQASVVNYSRDAQHPQYGKIRNPNLDKGDFVFKLADYQDVEAESASKKDGPPAIGSAFDDLDQELQWRDYLHTMEEAFSKIERYEKLDLPVESKVTIWERFINTFTEDNPYSNRDEELLQIAEERLGFWNENTQEEQPLAILGESIFSLGRITVQDAAGNPLQAVDEIYPVNVGEKITITVEVEHLPDHIVEATWMTYNGKVSPTTELTNTYTARKTGPDYVIVNVWNAYTGDEIEEPINLHVMP